MIDSLRHCSPRVSCPQRCLTVRPRRRGRAHDERHTCFATSQTRAEKSRTVLEQQKRWADLDIERKFPWDRLFLAVEKSVSDDVELHELIPDKTSRQLFLRGEVRDRAALISLIDALAAQPMLVNGHLTRMDRKKRDRLETVEFEIKARLSP